MTEDEIVVGARFFIWGHHMTVKRERIVGKEREVRLIPDGAKRAEKYYPWVAAHRVALRARPSSP